MERTITIGGQEVGFRASGLTVKLYRRDTGRDFMRDLARLDKRLKDTASDPEAQLEAIDLEAFEDIAYLMARQYAHAHQEAIAATADEWLDGFEMFEIYRVLPEILKLWADSTRTTSVPKKA